MLQQILNGKIAFKLVTSTHFLREKYARFFIKNKVTKGLTLRMV